MGKEFDVEKLNGSDNYHTWQFVMTNLLAFKGYARCIVRAEPTPTGTGTSATRTLEEDESLATGTGTPATVAQSTRPATTTCAETNIEKCEKAKETIILCIEPKLFIHINNCDSALSVWECLKKLYENKGLSREIALLVQLILPRLEECDGMQEYIDKKISAANKLTGIGFEVNDEWLGCILLAGLTEEYRPMIMSIESNGQNISADYVTSKLVDVQSSAKSDQWKENA